MSQSPIRIAEDRSLVVPPGHVVKTAWVPITDIELACRDRMSCGDVEIAYRRRLHLGDAQPWPPPVGRWLENGKFAIHDGRHCFVAALMLGAEHVLVAWTENTRDAG